MNSCSGDMLIKKSQNPLKPFSVSTSKSLPENKLTASDNSFLIYIKIGVTIISDRAFSKAIDKAKGILYRSVSVK